MTVSRLKDLQRGDTAQGIYLVESSNFKQAKNNKFFIQLTVRDRSTSVRALRWEASRADYQALVRSGFLDLTGRVEEFQGNLQIIIDRFQPLAPGDSRVDPRDFLPQSEHDPRAMQAELEAIVAALPDAGLRRLVSTVLARPEVARGLTLAPAGKTMHHAYLGGLLEHILSLARLGQSILSLYPWLDASVLMAGIVLHDLGKVVELSYERGFGYTDPGQLLGHIVLVLGWIDEAAAQLPDLDAERLLEVRHLVVSHHGKLEFGSPRTPMTGEALALHYLDNLDAKLAAYRAALGESPSLEVEGERWGEYLPMFGTRLYFPTRLCPPPVEDDATAHPRTAPPPASPAVPSAAGHAPSAGGKAGPLPGARGTPPGASAGQRELFGGG